MNKLKKNPFIIFAIVFFLFIFSLDSLSSRADENTEENRIYTSVNQLSKALKGEWENYFIFVRDKIHFEPSTYILKPHQGVLWTGRGNAREQAMLLAELLTRRGEKVRYAMGTLDDKKAVSLIESIFFEKREFSYSENIPIYDPSQDNELLSAVKNHYWIQILKNNHWVDLDPSFPDAEVGKAYASLGKTSSHINKDLLPKITIYLNVEKRRFRENNSNNSESQTILKWQGTIQEISNQPVSLVIMADFRSIQEEEKENGLHKGLLGGLSGSSSRAKEEKTKELEVSYQANLMIKGEDKGRGCFSQIIPISPDERVDEETITRVWLHFKVENLGEKVLETERILFEKLQDADTPALFQRHSILITANRIPIEAWEEELSKVLDKELLDEVKSGVEEIKKSLKSQQDKNAILKRSVSLEKKIGPELGHLINMIFAYTSDNLSEDAQRALSIFGYYSLPRIIITSFEGTGEEAHLSIDLRQDTIEAIPYPGQAIGMKETFLYGRGVIESILEGKVLELFLGKKTLTTAFLMQEAARNDIPLRLYSYLEKEEVKKLGMPSHVTKIALSALESGDILILPDSSIEFNGEERWGWWVVNPRTRQVIGVLDTGLHQAMLQRTILETKGPLQTKMGFVIGAMVGAIDTQWVIVSMILKYGELNKEALKEVKSYMKEINAYLCPGFEKKVSATLASATLIDIEDCYKKEFSIGGGGGVKIDMGWCDKFAKGFACASTSILNYYLSQY